MTFPVCHDQKSWESFIFYSFTHPTCLVLPLTTSQSKLFFSSQYLEDPIAKPPPPLSLFSYSPGPLTCILHLLRFKSNLKFHPLYKVFPDYFNHI